MDQNSYNPPTGGQPEQTPKPPAGPLIRTMAKDIETLGKKPSEEPAAFQPPAGYEPPPEMPLGMAPPMEIPAPPAENQPYPAPQIPKEPPMEIPPPPASPAESTETVISEKALTEFAPPQPPKKDIKKLALIAGIVGAAVIFGFLGWFLYPRIFPTATPTPTPVLPTPTPETPVPTPATPTPTPTLISFFQKMPEKTAILNVAGQTKTEFIGAIKNEIQKIETVGTLKIIDFRMDGTPLAFNDFSNFFGLQFPDELKPLISSEFKFFVNYHAQEGSQLGLIFHLTDAIMAPPFLQVWENSMHTDLDALFLDKDIGTPTEFKDGIYRGVDKRYLYFSKPPFSLDYGLYQNFLIIATSRFSFANAVDHILGE